MGNLFDTAKPFAEKFGKVFFYIAAIALVANWLYSAYNAGDIAGNYDIETQSRSFNFGKFLLRNENTPTGHSALYGMHRELIHPHRAGS